MRAQTILQPGPVGGSSRDSGSWWCTHSCANQWWVCSPSTALPPRQQLYWVGLGDSAQKQNQNSSGCDQVTNTKQIYQKQEIKLKLHHLKGASWTETVCIHLWTLAGTSDLTLDQDQNSPPINTQTFPVRFIIYCYPWQWSLKAQELTGRENLLTDQSKFRAKNYLHTTEEASSALK